MFKFKLNNGKLVDATNKSIFIGKKAIRDGNCEYSGDVIDSPTQFVRFIVKDIKSIVTDDKEINIDASKPTDEIIEDIKSVFNEYNIVQTDSETETPNPDESEPQTVTVIYLVDGEEYLKTTGFPGETYKITQPTKNGYNFIGWEPDDNNQTFPTEDATYNAVFEPIAEAEVVKDVFILSELGSITTVEGSIDDLFDALSSGENITFNGAVLDPIEPSIPLTNAHYSGNYNNVSISAYAIGGEVLTDQSVFDPTNFKIVVTEGTTGIDITVTTTFVA